MLFFRSFIVFELILKIQNQNLFHKKTLLKVGLVLYDYKNLLTALEVTMLITQRIRDV